MKFAIRKRQIQIGLSTAVIGSILFHVFFGLSLLLYQPKPMVQDRIEIQMVETPPPMPKMEDVIKDSAKQIVDQDDKALNKEIDPKAKFLSKNDQKVEKQTLAKQHGDFQNRATRATNPGNGGQKQFKMSDFTPKFDVAKAVRDRQTEEKKFDQDPDAYKLAQKQKQKERDPAQANPSAVKPGETGEQVSQSVDYIKDLDPGLETLLSTREFVYYTYYARIRRQLNQFWGPKVKEKLVAMYRSGRQIASSSDKITKCLITLDKEGKLVRVQIIGISGVHELDEAAVEAFKLAEPFPNPPKGIIEDDGTIRLRWDFILEV
jgi:protein TonB